MDSSNTTTTAGGATTQQRAQAQNAFREGRSTGRQLMGLPVISLSGGENKGRVHDVIYSPLQGKLVGFTVRQGGGLLSHGDTFLLSTDRVHAIGQDAVTIDDTTVLEPLQGDLGTFEEEAGEPVLGKRLMTENGKFLGNIDDVLIDRQSRRVVAYQVSGGLWQDMMRGQTDVPVDKIISIGKDVVLVPEAVESAIEQPSGGLVAAAEAAKEKVAHATEAVKEKAAEARTSAAVAIENKEADYARGKVANKAVEDDAGNLIVPAGATVTDAHIRAAIAAGKLHALAIAAGQTQAGDLADTAREKVAHATETVREKAADATDAAKDKQGELLVGKTTGRAVTLENGATLVPANHVITEADVSAARAAGKLGDLTAAVGAQAVNDVRERAAGVYDAPAAAPATAPAAAPTVVIVEQPVVVQASRPDDRLNELEDDDLTVSPPAAPAARTDSSRQ